MIAAKAPNIGLANIKIFEYGRGYESIAGLSGRNVEIHRIKDDLEG